jgi:hypothetical protein
LGLPSGFWGAQTEDGEVLNPRIKLSYRKVGPLYNEKASVPGVS